MWYWRSRTGNGHTAIRYEAGVRPVLYRENGRKLKESTGMGLYLVKEVVHKMNHQIELESEQGKGTTVRLIFSG